MLSWTGRLAAFKVLPQILYIFSTVPIPVPKKILSNLQSSLFNFLWEGKKERCAFSKLSKTRGAGGAGIPVFTDYHMTAEDGFPTNLHNYGVS